MDLTKQNLLEDIIQEYKAEQEIFEREQVIKFTRKCIQFIIKIKAVQIDLTPERIIEIVEPTFDKDLIDKYNIRSLLEGDLKLDRIVEFAKAVGTTGGEWGAYLTEQEFNANLDNINRSLREGVLQNFRYTKMNDTGNRNVKIWVDDFYKVEEMEDAVTALRYTFGERYFNFRPTIFNLLGLYYKDQRLHRIDGKLFTYNPHKQEIIRG